MTSFLGSLLGGMLAYGIILGTSYLIVWRRDKLRAARAQERLSEFLQQLQSAADASKKPATPAPTGPAN